MSDTNIIRFRAEPRFLFDLGARSNGESPHETARCDLAEYYARLSAEQWPDARQRMIEAFEGLHAVAFDAAEATGCRAILPLNVDGKARDVPIYGHNGLRRSIEIMVGRELLHNAAFTVYTNLEALYDQIVVHPDRTQPLGEVHRFLKQVYRLREDFEQFIPEHQRSRLP